MENFTTNRETVKRILTAYTIGFMGTSTIVLIVTWLDAYLRGGWTKIYVNSAGEAGFELLLIGLFVVCVIAQSLLSIKTGDKNGD